MLKNIGFGDHISKVYFLFFFGICLLLSLSFLSGADIRGVESNVIFTIQQILVDNSLLYQNPAKLPYAITQYTPLYYIICDLILTLFDVNEFDVFNIRMISKLVSLVFLVASVFNINRIFRVHFKLPKSDAFLLVSLFIVVSFPWFIISRPDVLVSYFMLLCIDLFFCFLSLASKQTGILFSLIFGLYLLINELWRAVFFLGFGFIVCAIFFSLLMLSFGYDFTFFKENIIDGVSDFSLLYAIKATYQDFVLYYTFLIFGIVFFIKDGFVKMIHSKKTISFFLTFLVLLLLLLFSMVFALKKGSGINYFNDFLIVLLLLLGYSIITKKDYLKYKKKNFVSFLFLVGIQVSIVHFYYYSERIAKGIYEEHLSNSTLRNDIKYFLNNNIEDAYFYSDDRRINLNNFKNCILPQIEIHQAALNKGAYQYNNLREDFYNGKIKYLILYSNVRPILNIDVINYYSFEGEMGGLKIFKYKEL
ncbi:hypothetical protein A9Q87_05510 [Flavobacteriales bacterium 34_180_T64]|nr:hypothetical protein A9Q87_05510 [Flavobacteriales bacterium 34_180_T64]